MSKKQRLRKGVRKESAPVGHTTPNKWWIHLLLTSLVLVVYANSLNNDFVSDDIAAILENPNRTNLMANFTRAPFGFAYTIIRHFTALVAGNNPLPYRLVNILFHSGSANLLLAILWKMIGFGPAIAAALIFGVHPLLTEGVSWISGAPYSAGTFFGLLAIFFYLQSPSIKNDWKSWLAYLCALSFTQITITIAPILTVYEFFQKYLRKKLSRLAFFWCTGVGFTILTLVNLSSRILTYKVASGGVVDRPSLTTLVPVAIGNYLELFFWPDKLSLYHSEMSFSLVQFSWLVIITLTIIGLIVWGWFRDRRISFWLLWFLLGISITLTGWGANWIVAERYVYFGSIGLIVALVLLYERWFGQKLGFGFNLTILILVISGLSLRTFVRNIDWQNQDNLWLATAKNSPNSPQNHNNLGDVYSRRGDHQKAIEEFGKAISLNPRYADAYHNLGNTYLTIGKLNEAETNFFKALEINPNLWQSYAQLAVIYAQKKDWDKANQIVKKGIAVSPNDNLSRILESLKEASRLDTGN